MWWDIGKGGKEFCVFKQLSWIYQLLVHTILQRWFFIFPSSSTHQAFIASICFVHFHHIIWTFYKCHKCVTSDKLCFPNSTTYYLFRHTVRKLGTQSYKWTQISFDMLILIEKVGQFLHMCLWLYSCLMNWK